MPSEREVLTAGLLGLGIDLDETKIAQLLHFVGLIQKWNKTYNLSGVRDSIDMVRLHLLDSLAVLPHLKLGSVIDVGTGAGLPGIPLAICRPECRFVLLDGNAKKTRFVQQVLLELSLKNAQVVQMRVEQYQPLDLFNTVIMRAFASLADIQQLTRHLLLADGELLAMKGMPSAEELATAAQDYTVIPLTVPGVEAERCLIRISMG